MKKTRYLELGFSFLATSHVLYLPLVSHTPLLASELPRAGPQPQSFWMLCAGGFASLTCSQVRILPDPVTLLESHCLVASQEACFIQSVSRC